MTIPDQYKVDHLFLLIGENPLPNYVAARLLIKPKTAQEAKKTPPSIVLVCSTGTANTEDRLRRILKNEFKIKNQSVQIQPLNLTSSQSSPQQIYRAIEKKAKSLQGKIGLNYTGGTKAMSVQTYHCLFKLFQESQISHPYFSYLDPNTLQIIIEDQESGKVNSFAIKPEDFSTNLRTLFKLHNLKWKDVGFSNLKQLCEWLDGIWLEHYVLSILQNEDFVERYKITESKMSFHIKDPRTDREKDQFEFDVAFLRGYQLFAISCTTIDLYCKQKLFEAYLRAQQLGGREARVALVCCYHKPEWLENEISFLEAKRNDNNKTERDKYQKKVKVFGREHLKNIDQEISKWVKYNQGVQ